MHVLCFTAFYIYQIEFGCSQHAYTTVHVHLAVKEEPEEGGSIEPVEDGSIEYWKSRSELLSAEIEVLQQKLHQKCLQKRPRMSIDDIKDDNKKVITICCRTFWFHVCIDERSVVVVTCRKCIEYGVVLCSILTFLLILCNVAG